jgi:hypothetical protein
MRGIVHLAHGNLPLTLFFVAVLQAVHYHRQHDEKPDENPLPIRGHPDQVEAVAQDAQDQGADQVLPRRLR